LLGGTPVGCLLGLAVTFVALRVGVAAGWLPEVALRIGGVAVVHGGLLATAIAWIRRDRGLGRGLGEPVPHRLIVLLAPALALALASTVSHMSSVGGIAYMAVPVMVWGLGGRALLTLTPTSPVVRVRSLLVGALVGAALGAHLVVAASRTLGHHPRVGEISALFSALAYDVGANALSAEAFFRGALWRRLYYQGSLRAAVAISTAACVGRYLVDPLLPKTLEMAVGATFYVAVLGAANCFLLRWSGGLAPGYVASCVFFTAYRLLGVS
jgi:hypothetical protein